MVLASASSEVVYPYFGIGQPPALKGLIVRLDDAAGCHSYLAAQAQRQRVPMAARRNWLGFDVVPESSLNKLMVAHSIHGNFGQC